MKKKTLIYSLSFFMMFFLICCGFLAFEYRKAEMVVRKKPLTQCGYSLSSASIPVSLVTGIMAQEDHLFFRHKGFNWWEVRESFFANLANGRIVRGASTIDMQVASLCYLNHSFLRLLAKFREVLYTRLLNRIYSKEEILRAYITTVPLIENSSTGGFSEASLYYYGKPLTVLSYGEQWGLILALRSRDTLNPHALAGGEGRSKFAEFSLEVSQKKQPVIDEIYRDYILKHVSFVFEKEFLPDEEVAAVWDSELVPVRESKAEIDEEPEPETYPNNEDIGL